MSYCQRCNQELTVGEGWDREIPNSMSLLSRELIAFINRTEWDFLCNDCLVQLGQLLETAKQQPSFSHKMHLEEGIHYYKEGEFWVFTELYHLLKGYCCKNGCRHCVYGFRKGGENVNAEN